VDLLGTLAPLGLPKDTAVDGLDGAKNLSDVDVGWPADAPDRWCSAGADEFMIASLVAVLALRPPNSTFLADSVSNRDGCAL
jgi:hypothetical protein